MLKGILGAGSHGLIKASVWSLAQHVPVIVEIVDRPEKMLAEIRRCLKRDGYAIVEVPTETWFFKAIWSVWTSFGPGKAWHHAHVVDFKGDLLERIVKEAGFKITRHSVFMGMLRAFVIMPA